MAQSWTSVGPYGGDFIGSAINPSNLSEVVTITNNPGACYRSTDGGQTWTRAASITGSTLCDFAAFGVARLYAITSSRCYWSADGGRTWSSSVFPSAAGLVFALAVHPTDGNKVFAAGVAYDTGEDRLSFLTSADGGQTWAVTKNLAFEYFDPRDMAVSKTNPNVMYVCGTKYDSSWNYYGALLKSTNGGAAWSDISSAVDATTYREFYSAAVDPTDVNRVYVGGYYVYRTGNGGSTWSRTTTYMDVGAVAVDPNEPARIYVAGGGAFFVSEDRGQTWSARSIPMTARGKYLAIASVSGSPVYGSTNRGLYCSKDRGQSWKEAHTGICNTVIPAIAVAPSQPATLFVEVEGSAVLSSRDSGRTWSECGYFLGCGSICDLLVHPTNPNSILALEGFG